MAKKHRDLLNHRRNTYIKNFQGCWTYAPVDKIRKGVLDLYIYYKGQLYVYEFKTGDDKLTQLQINTAITLIENGAYVYLEEETRIITLTIPFLKRI